MDLGAVIIFRGNTLETDFWKISAFEIEEITDFSLFVFVFSCSNTTETRVLINIPREQERYFFRQRFPSSLPGARFANFN